MEKDEKREARHEFVLNALAPDANVSALCREAWISRKTGYKWLKRFKQAGLDGVPNLYYVRGRSRPMSELSTSRLSRGLTWISC